MYCIPCHHRHTNTKLAVNFDSQDEKNKENSSILDPYFSWKVIKYFDMNQIHLKDKGPGVLACATRGGGRTEVGHCFHLLFSGNFNFFMKKTDFHAFFRNGQLSVTEPGPTPSPWSIIPSFCPLHQLTRGVIHYINSLHDDSEPIHPGRCKLKEKKTQQELVLILVMFSFV